ncbi:MAG: hypothetical protein WC683_20490 [bacterium]
MPGFTWLIDPETNAPIGNAANPLVVSGSVTSTPGAGNQAVTIANGADVATGAIADAGWTGTGNGTVISILKAVYGKLIGQQPINIATAQVSVGTAATGIVPGRANRKNVRIVNHGTTDVFIGDSGVTTTTGTLLQGVIGYSITIEGNAAVFGIVATGTQTVSYLEAY